MAHDTQSNTDKAADRQIEAAMEIVRSVTPLIDLARAERLAMVSQEATRVAGQASTSDIPD